MEWDKYVEPVKYLAKNNTVEVPMKPFEIKTLKLKVRREGKRFEEKPGA
jgi:hypothetical protein